MELLWSGLLQLANRMLTANARAQSPLVVILMLQLPIHHTATVDAWGEGAAA